MQRCLTKRRPLRGAISYGEVTFGHDQRIIMGPAFVEAHQYAEDQNWIELVLTPSAGKKLLEIKINPEHNQFVLTDVPFRKYPMYNEHIYANNFREGKCHLPYLQEMLRGVKKDEIKVKYLNTTTHINKFSK